MTPNLSVCGVVFIRERYLLENQYTLASHDSGAGKRKHQKRVKFKVSVQFLSLARAKINWAVYKCDFRDIRLDSYWEATKTRHRFSLRPLTIRWREMNRINVEKVGILDLLLVAFDVTCLRISICWVKYWLRRRWKW